MGFNLYTGSTNTLVNRGFIKGCAPGKLTSCERDLAINLPGCFHLLFLLSFKRKTKNVWLNNPTDLLHKNLMKNLGKYSMYFSSSLPANCSYFIVFFGCRVITFLSLIAYYFNCVTVNPCCIVPCIFPCFIFITWILTDVRSVVQLHVSISGIPFLEYHATTTVKMSTNFTLPA